VLVELLFGAGIANFAMNVCSPDTNKNTNKTDGCREYTEFASLISSFDLLPQTFAYAFNVMRRENFRENKESN
jgi:hypothetical protein